MKRRHQGAKQSSHFKCALALHKDSVKYSVRIFERLMCIALHLSSENCFRVVFVSKP